MITMDMQNTITILPPIDTDDLSENQRNNNNTKTSNRPVSFYDNIRINGQEIDPSQFNRGEFTLDNENLPSQAPLINTTVPQNIGASNIGSRHEPTRNSLRHSRMIVLTRTGNVSKRCLLPIMRYRRLAKSLVGLQILIGVALLTSSLWLLLWAPNLRSRDNPCWSGIPMLVSGILGVSLLCCCKKEYPRIPKRYFVYFLKIASILLSTIAGTSCLIACIFAIIHLISLSTMSCAPVNQLNSTCFCQIESSNSTSLPIKSYHYIDLNCPEVNNVLSILIIFTCGTNCIGTIIAFWYVYLYWASRYNYKYSKVRTDDNKLNNTLHDVDLE